MLAMHTATAAQFHRRLVASCVATALAATASMSAPALAADLEFCVGRPELLAVFEQSAEALPTVDLTSSVRESVTRAREQSASRQAALERSRQQSREQRDSRGTSETVAYSVSSEDSKALQSLVAAQPKRSAAASGDLLAQAAKIGTEAAGVEAARLIAAGASPADARRAGQQHGLALARTAVKAAGGTLSSADAKRLEARVVGEIDAGTATSGVAAWARSATQKVAQSRTRERSTRSEASESASESDSSKLSESQQESRSRNESAAVERALSVPVRLDWNRDVLQALYPGRVTLPGNNAPVRLAQFTCAEQTLAMASASHGALQYATSRDPGVADAMRKVDAIARTGNLYQFAAALTSLLDDSRPAARATALAAIYGVGSTRMTRLEGIASTVLQQHTLDAIQRQFVVLDNLVLDQLAGQGRQPGPLRSDAMPPFAPPPAVTTMGPTPPESQMYMLVELQRTEYARMQRTLGRRP